MINIEQVCSSISFSTLYLVFAVDHKTLPTVPFRQRLLSEAKVGPLVDRGAVIK
jgi:hypothetical protein